MLQHRDPATFFAFIVGNEAYPSAPLAKCVADAEDMRDLLLASGYPPGNVVTVFNASKADLLSALRQFVVRLDGAVGCHVVVFYSGHGLEGAGDNFLLPVDFDATSYAGVWQVCCACHL